MGINLVAPRSVFLPAVPADIDSKTREYLMRLIAAIELQFSKQFDNVYAILSTGTSGSFVDSDGNTVTVVNGIITALS